MTRAYQKLAWEGGTAFGTFDPFIVRFTGIPIALVGRFATLDSLPLPDKRTPCAPSFALIKTHGTWKSQGIEGCALGCIYSAGLPWTHSHACDLPAASKHRRGARNLCLARPRHAFTAIEFDALQLMLKEYLVGRMEPI